MPSRLKFLSVWAERTPPARRPSYPRLKGPLETDVAIAGGGLAGCAAAYVFAAAGVRTVLVEAERIGEGATAGSTGLLRPDPAASFRDASAAHGLKDARILWQGTRRAALDFAAALRRLGIRCDPAAADALTVARAATGDERRLRREYDAQRAAGLEVAWLGRQALAREAAIDLAPGAIRTRDGAQFDPLRAALGLVRAASAKGAQIFEKTPAVRIRTGRKAVEIRTPSGQITAGAVIVATGYPPQDLRGLRRHFSRELQYCVVTEPLTAAGRRTVGRRQASIQDLASPSHTLRWMKDDTIVFSGAAQPLLPPRSRAKALEQRAWQLMYELSLVYPSISGIQPTHAWDLETARTVDGLPYLGTHRNYPRHLFALGIDPHRLGHCWLAAKLLLRSYQGTPEKTDAPFGFSRVL